MTSQNTEQNNTVKTSLWAGRIAPLLGIVLLGISLRHAVTGLSPLLTTITNALGIGTAGATLIGMLPTISFGLGGFATTLITKRLGQEGTALFAVSLAKFGALLRPFIDIPSVFIGLSFVALFGMGIGNVIGAPLVKKYFPARQAGMITVFTLLMQAGATLPAMTAIPIADAANWRISLASWAIFSLLAVLPWTLALLKHRRQNNTASSDGSKETTGSGPELGLRKLMVSPIALGTALFYAMASLNIYAMLAWMPTILEQELGLSTADAATAFSVYTFMTLPMAVVTPWLANKMGNPTSLAVVLAAAGPIGYLGFVFGVGPTWLASLFTKGLMKYSML
jgi:MFS transporter, CP family, cyanate transporter